MALSQRGWGDPEDGKERTGEKPEKKRSSRTGVLLVARANHPGG